MFIGLSFGDANKLREIHRHIVFVSIHRHIVCSSLFIDISCSSPVPASAVPDNWCQKWDVQRRDDGSKKATLGAAECLQ